MSAGGLPFLLSLPPFATCRGNASVPLVLFLHGAGESGSDAWGLLPGYDHVARAWLASAPQPVRTTPPGLAVDDSPLVRGFAVLAPVTDRGWDLTASHRAVLALLDEVLARYACVDPRRVVLTGISMGGAGTFSLGAAAAARFAGVSPICGYVNDDAAAVVSALRGKPVYVAHGTNDVVIPESESRRVVDGLRAAAGSDAALVVYESFVAGAPAGGARMVGHDSWTRAYSSPAWWTWAAGVRLP